MRIKGLNIWISKLIVIVTFVRFVRNSQLNRSLNHERVIRVFALVLFRKLIIRV